MDKIKEYLKHNIDIVLLVSGTVPLTYQYLTGLTLPNLLYICSIASAVALEVVLVKQVYQKSTNIYGAMSILISSLFLVLISFAYYVPSSLFEAEVIIKKEYIIISALLEAIIHSVFALLILCTAMSKRHNNSGMNKHIENYKEQAASGFVCDVCGKVCKTQTSLKAHKTRAHSD
jgi:hypothetical protein